MAYRRVRSYGNTMGATRGTETANSSRAPEYTSGCLLPVVTVYPLYEIMLYTSMRKGPGSAYDKWNISVVICGSLFSSVFLS
jgi:hypothetical protein